MDHVGLSLNGGPFQSVATDWLNIQVQPSATGCGNPPCWRIRNGAGSDAFVDMAPSATQTLNLTRLTNAWITGFAICDYDTLSGKGLTALNVTAGLDNDPVWLMAKPYNVMPGACGSGRNPTPPNLTPDHVGNSGPVMQTRTVTLTLKSMGANINNLNIAGDFVVYLRVQRLPGKM
jgi:hypothetical protein